MDMVWMDKFTFHSLKQKGQSTVEYILLLGVIMMLTTGILNSDAFQNFLGPDSEFLTVMKNRMEYSYRHGQPGTSDTTNYNSAQHDTYLAPTGQTRFFLPEQTYP